MEYKISKFNHWKGKKLFNDYTDQMIRTNPLMRLVYEMVENRKVVPTEFESIYDFLIDKKIFVPINCDQTQSYNILKVDIDVNTHCNASCVYCPQSVSPRSAKVMPMEKFKQIVDKLKHLDLKWLALHIYGEPLLDTYYKQRVDYLSQQNIPLYFFSNATLLTDDLIEFLSSKNLYGAMFNFPSIDRLEWKKFTSLGDKQFERARNGIENFISMFSEKISRLEIVVNGNSTNHQQRTDKVREHFGKFGNIIVNGWESNSRAGNLKNEFVKEVFHGSNVKFEGCPRVVNQLHINIDGDVILCCQDYYQSIKLGNILDMSIEEIMNSEKMINIRSQIYGLQPMNENMLCNNCSMIRYTNI